MSNIDLWSLESWILWDPVVYLLMATIVYGVFRLVKYIIIRN